VCRAGELGQRREEKETAMQQEAYPVQFTVDYLWVPESRSWVLSCGFVSSPANPCSRRRLGGSCDEIALVG
jgi:hypothetical protein